MQEANLETLSPLERRLNLSVPLGPVEEEVENRLKRMTKTVRVHGFRPGKVPYKIVSQQYGSQVRNEVLGDTMQKSLADAIEAQQLKVAGYPRIEPKPLAEGAENLEFSATFEVYPDVELKDIGELPLERPVHEISDADIDHTIDILRKQRTEFTDVDRAAQEGDKANIDFRGTIDGEPFEGGEGQGMDVVLGQGQTLPEFEGGIVGMKAGDSKTVEVKFPEDYHGKEVAGKTAQFEIKLNSVAAPQLPEVDEAFVREFGIEDGTVDSFRKEIRENLEREVQKRIQGRLKDQVMDKLLENNQVELPRSLVENEVSRLMERTWQDFEQRGLNRKDVPLQASYFEEQAKRRVALGLILSELVDRNKLVATPEQVRAKIDEFASTYEQPEQVVNYYYADPNRLAEVENVVLEDNVVNWVVDHAKVEDKPVAFEELMGTNQ